MTGVVNSDDVAVILTYTSTEYNSTTVPTQAGKYTVTATIANTNYSLTGTITADFVITKATVEVPTNAGSKTYNASQQTSDIAETNDYTITTNVGGTSAGDYDVVITLKDNANYKWADGEDTSTRMITFSITTANNSVSNATLANWIYGQTANMPSATATFGTVQYKYYTKDGVLLSDTSTNAGTYKVKAYVPASGHDYTEAYSAEFTTFIISPKLIEVVWKGEGNGDFSWVYTGSAIVPTATVNTGIADDTIALTVTGEKTNVGSYEATATMITPNSNYTLTKVKCEFDITLATITDSGAFTDYNSAYDKVAHGIGSDSSKLTVVGKQEVTVEYRLKETDNWSATQITYTDFTDGAQTVYWKVSAPNHNAITGSNTVTITKKAITVMAENKSSVHNADLVELTYSVSPALYAGDSFMGAIATNTNKATVGEYQITQGNLVAGDNYEITFIPAKYKVTAKDTISITETAQNFTYDGNGKAFAIVGSDLTDFTIEYFVDGSYTQEAPIYVSSYNVKVTRPEDDINYEFSCGN